MADEALGRPRGISGEVPVAGEATSENASSIKLFGFWIYIMSDCILFAVLFATFAVLGQRYAGGPTGAQIFDLPGVLIETLCLLVSSFTYGLAVLGLHAGKKDRVLGWLVVTFLLGVSFVILEVNEFVGLASAGNGPWRSAFLSAFFTLVSTHGLHVTTGLLWMAVMITKVARQGLTPNNGTRLMLLSLFWHFLDIVWVGVFTLVYLMGTILPK